MIQTVVLFYALDEVAFSRFCNVNYLVCLISDGLVRLWIDAILDGR